MATIPGAFTSMLIISYANAGTATVVSPRSIISVIATSPTPALIGINIAGVLSGTIVTFAIASLILHFNKKKARSNGGMQVSFTDEGIIFNNNLTSQINSISNQFDFQKVRKIVVACDAGMGSSALGAGLIRKWLKEEKINLIVLNTALKDIPPDADIIVTQEVFANFAKQKNPNAYVHLIKQFLNKKDYANLIEQLIKNKKG